MLTAAGSGPRTAARTARPFDSRCRWGRRPPSRPTRRKPVGTKDPEASPGTPRPLVLVVEDEPQMMRFLRATLPSQGYRVVEAATGQQGLVEAAMRSPDLVLLDLGLPDMDGVEGMRRLREWSATPV